MHVFVLPKVLFMPLFRLLLGAFAPLYRGKQARPQEVVLLPLHRLRESRRGKSHRAMVLVISILLSLPFCATASDNPATQLSELLGKAQTLRGGFAQLTLSASGTRLQEVGGQMALQRPGMFRWHTDAPLEQLLVSNGQTVWLYDPDLEQVTVQKLDERLTHTPALLLSGDVSKISENFEITQENTDEQSTFTLKPKSADSLFDSLRLSFRRGLISEMQLIDNSGQRTSIHFLDVKMNRVLVGTTFEFEIPPGTDVIEQ